MVYWCCCRTKDSLEFILIIKIKQNKYEIIKFRRFPKFAIKVFCLGQKYLNWKMMLCHRGGMGEGGRILSYQIMHDSIEMKPFILKLAWGVIGHH